VKLSIYKNNILIKELFEESKKGYTDFYLDSNIFENNMYKIIVSTAGIKKEFKNLNLW
ncbi:MAG: hypothetical protein ACI9EK_002400, partial [Psychroserpens sp.]